MRLGRLMLPIHLSPRLWQPPTYSQRRQISALYVTGDKANQTYVALQPYFDFASRLAIDEPIADAPIHRRLQENIAARGQTAACDVPQLLQLWSMYRDVQRRKVALERRRVQIAGMLKALNAAGGAANDDDDGGQRKLRADGAQVRDDLKRLKENSYAMEDTFVHQFLALPNELHPRTPTTNDTDDVLFTFGPTTIDGTPHPAPHDHRDGTAHLLEYHNPYCYFLLDEAADFELAATTHFSNALRGAGFVRTSNPDFCRSLLAEAAALNVDRDLLTVLEDGGNADDKSEASAIDRTHLCGAGSLVSFLGYCAKLAPFRSALPLRLCGTGRTYARRSADDEATASEPGLYGVAQSTAVQCFQAAATAADAEQLFDETVALLAQLYAPFGRPGRVVQVPAERLLCAQSLRADVELWSAHRAEYVRVAEVAFYGDYVSKRLLFSYKPDAVPGGRKKTKEEQKQQLQQKPLFAHLVGGTVLDVSRLLAVLLEDGADFRVPSFMREEGLGE